LTTPVPKYMSTSVSSQTIGISFLRIGWYTDLPCKLYLFSKKKKREDQ
jgi:hypothetical protein